MQIRFIHENKGEYLKAIEPQAIHNRFDLKDGDYDLVEVSDDAGKERAFVPVKDEGDRLVVGLYLRKPEVLTGGGIQAFTDGLFALYPHSREVFFLHTYVPLPHIEPHPHWHVDLPDTIEAFDAELSSVTRRNAKRFPKRIKRDMGDWAIDVLAAAECPEWIVQKYLDWKKESHGYEWTKPPMTYLSSNGITHVYLLHTEREPLAIGFDCETGDNCFFENFSFNKDFAKYAPGTILYHYLIEDLIRKGKKKLFLLGGDLDYKRRFNGIRTETWTGCVYRDWEKVCKARRIGARVNALPISVRMKKRLLSIVRHALRWEKYYQNKMKEEIC